MDHVPLVVMVSVPPKLSLHPVKVGVLVRLAVRPEARVLAFSFEPVQVTVTGKPLILPLLTFPLLAAVKEVLAGRG